MDTKKYQKLYGPISFKEDIWQNVSGRQTLKGRAAALFPVRPLWRAMLTKELFMCGSIKSLTLLLYGLASVCIRVNCDD